MIQFPRNLHNLHQFKRNGEQFVADLDAGVVIPVPEVVCDVLNVCGASETDVVIETLSDKHSRSEVLEALAFLAKLSEMGILFSPDPSNSGHPRCPERLKIYITPSVAESRDRTPFLLSAANHHLTTLLAVHADVYLGLPETLSNYQEIAESLRAEGVQPIFFRNDRTFSPAKFIPKDCDGILTLSPLTEGEQVFLKFNTIPTVLRLSSEALISHKARNTALERCAALKHFDAFACDASWTQTFFADFVPDMRIFHHIPYGVDTSVFKPMDKTACKHQLSQALGNAEILQKPLVGVVPGLHPHETLRFMQKLRSANPDLNYLVIHSSLMDDFTGDGCVNFFNIASQQDKEASPFIFNALDALLFPTILGASPLLLLEIVACGIPTVVWGNSVPKEMSGACRFVQVAPSLFDPVQLPVETISQELKFLFENPDEQKRLGQEGLEAVSIYTYEAAVQRILNLFRELRSRPVRQSNPTKLRLLFRKHYNLVSGEIESEALVLSKVPSAVDVEQGIAMSLLEEHTPMEIRTVFQSICQEPERVEKILESLL
ncbi:MAG: glycosyltransferase [Candidatus Poribacteria bacterium]|nr:glycosyltransferase [Candidatus Poribacteria bacterium]